uniref:Ig-like domain-containing protein n=1 Tax=Salarias fasciatus TaxID=181472 RepID=A0A672FIY5_SALFA
MKRVVGENATLPCHHQFWVGDDPTLDIEWLFLKPTNRQRVVITYFAGRVFDPNEAERGRVAFAGEYLKGDASLLISDLSLTDSGEYSCKVKTGAQYHWSTVSLVVLVKPSKPRCWMEGKLLEGGDVKMSCKSADGSDPIHYKWERVLDKGKYFGKLPQLTKISWKIYYIHYIYLKNPEIMTLKNLTQENTGIYKCTATNDVGQESCTVEVKIVFVSLYVLGCSVGKQRELKSLVLGGVLKIRHFHFSWSLGVMFKTRYLFQKIKHTRHSGARNRSDGKSTGTNNSNVGVWSKLLLIQKYFAEVTRGGSFFLMYDLFIDFKQGNKQVENVNIMYRG